MASSRICTIPGCNNPHDSRGFCSTHWQRWKKHGDPLRGGPINSRAYNGAPCSVDGCSQPARARGLCNKHYSKWRKHGDPTGQCARPPKSKRSASNPHTFEELSRLLAYDPETGTFRWRVRKEKTPWDASFNKTRAGKRAGSFWKHGYRVITVDDVRYGEHRVAWLLSHQCWPKKFIDHIDGDPSNNRLENLREATHHENAWNRRGCEGTSRYRGVFLSGETGLWNVVFMVRGENIRLGGFHCETAAALAYDREVVKHYGEFARLNLRPAA